MPLRALVKKECRLLIRDRLSAVILLLMPVLFILVLGLLLGEGFGQKPDNRLRISLVSDDDGVPGKSWFKTVEKDLLDTGGIRVETIGSLDEAKRLIKEGRRSAVLYFGKNFSQLVHACSFLDEPDAINPFFRDGVDLTKLDAQVLEDRTQATASAIIKQVGQVSMLRVVLPWMIGKAFGRLSDPAFIDRLGQEVNLPIPEDVRDLMRTGQQLFRDPRVVLARKLDPKLDAELTKLEAQFKIIAAVVYNPQATLAGSMGLLAGPTGFQPLLASSMMYPGRRLVSDRVQLAELLKLAAGDNPRKADEFRDKVGAGVKSAIQQQFSKYDLLGTSWEALTKSKQETKEKAQKEQFVDEAGKGFLNRGAVRYQILVPAYTVMFAFSLILTVGWLFVMERRQGTLRRLKAAPVSKGQVLLGKLLPCMLLSMFQGYFLWVAGKMLFGMSWGPDSWGLAQQFLMLFPVVFTTSLAAMGLSLLLAAVARSEIQVALIGSLLVLFLALLSGCLIPRELMPEGMSQVSHFTPHAWALDAYRQLLQRPTPGSEIQPNLQVVRDSCLVLTGFGLGSLALAWAMLRLD